MKKREIMLLVILLAIGFTTVSTTLILNGVIGLGSSDDFKIIFTSASIDGTKRRDVIGSDKTTINYETKTLTTVDEESELVYEATNTSRNYDAEVSIECNIVDTEGNKIEGTNIYVDLTYEPNSMTLLSGETKNGKVHARLLKAVTEPMDINIKCTLNATPAERDTLGDGYVDPNKLGGTMIAATFDKPNYATIGKFWDYKERITKVVFENTLTEHETTEDLIFDVSEAQDKSVMAYVVPNENYTLYINSDGKVVANENSSSLFFKFTNLKEIKKLEYLDTSNVLDMSRMFTNCSNLTILDLSDFDTSKVTSMRWMFSSCSNLTSLDLSSFNTSNVTDMGWMFHACQNLAKLDVKNFDTTSVVDMSTMFQGCALTSLDLSNFDTSSVTNMSSMFFDCSSLTTLDVSSFDTSKVTDMSYMFGSCTSLATLDLSSFNTSNVAEIRQMFSYCSSLTTLDLSNFNTSKVTDMFSMFSNCSNITTLDVSNFDTSKVTNMNSMFSDCTSLTALDLSNFDTSNVTNMGGLFGGCTSLASLDLSNFNTSNVTYMGCVFYKLPDVVSVTVKDKNTQDWIISLSSTPDSWGAYERPAAWTTENVIIKS